MNKSATPVRGRPRSKRKHREIITAAVELFGQHGFEGTSVDDIAAAAGVSKQTVYTHFGSKENLFGLAVSTKCKQHGMDPEAIDLDAPPEIMLPEIANSFMRLINSEEALRIHAICTANAETHPELAGLFFEHGPMEAVNVVKDYLAAQANIGRLCIDDPKTAAWQLLCMLKGEAHTRMQFNINTMSKKQQDAYTKDCVEMFLRAYAPLES